MLAESSNTISEPYSTDMPLQAVGACVSELLTAESVTKALPGTLCAIAKIVRIDRIVILEMRQSPNGTRQPLPFFAWKSEDAPRMNTAEIVTRDPVGRETMHEWRKPILQGKAKL